MRCGATREVLAARKPELLRKLKGNEPTNIAEHETAIRIHKMRGMKYSAAKPGRESAR